MIVEVARAAAEEFLIPSTSSVLYSAGDQASVGFFLKNTCLLLLW